MLCYRRHGHNEGDEPSLTQPRMYKAIKEHRSVRKIYTEQLLRKGDIDPKEAEEWLDAFQAQLQEAFDRTREDKEPPSSEREALWIYPISIGGGPKTAPSNTSGGGPKAAPSNTSGGGPKAAPSNTTVP